MSAQLHMTYSVFIRAVNPHFFSFSVAVAVLMSSVTYYMICDSDKMRQFSQMSN